MHPFYDGNGRMYKILFANDIIRQKYISKFKLYIKQCYLIV